MGGACCGCFSDVYERYPHLQKWEQQFACLKLTEKEIRVLFGKFRRVDNDKSGTIHIVELLTFFDLERNKFTERVFGIFDEDGSGCVDFKEFVVALWNYCTLTHSTLALFAFDLYDKDSSGVIDSNEVKLMLKEIYGANYTQNVHATRIGEKIESMTLQDIDKDVFREFTRRHPALLFPAFELQRVFRKHCLGEAFWKKLTQKRIDLSSGRFLSVGEIIEMLNREPLQRKLDREGGLGKVNIEALIVNQHQPGSIRRIATADREDDQPPAAKTQSLNLMASTITMASHAKRRASAPKVVPVSPASTDPLIDISGPGMIKKPNNRQTYPAAAQQPLTQGVKNSTGNDGSVYLHTAERRKSKPLAIDTSERSYNETSDRKKDRRRSKDSLLPTQPKTPKTPLAAGQTLHKEGSRSKIRRSTVG